MKTFFFSILMISLSSFMFMNGEKITITGKITDTSSVPVVGATVMVKGTNRGAASDVNGNYKLVVLPGDKTLVFSYLGMKTQEIGINGKTRINVILESDFQELEDCVVVGIHRSNDGFTQVRDKSSASAPQMSVVYNLAAPEFNTENYSAINDNGYKNVQDQPLSTFSIDVDRASYSNVRRFINQGQMPPADAVRIEEMINYFGYDYPKAKGDHPFTVYTEASVCPWNPKHQLLHVGLKGKEIEKENLPASNLVFLIDVSGSMQDYNKLPLLKSAFSLLVNELRPSDRVAIVVYAGAAGLVLESTPGSEKRKILDAIERLEAGGSTAGGEGLLLAYKTAESYFINGGNNRILLATDGDFNVGVSSNSEMERLVEKEREKGIAVTVLGFGMGNYKDDRMEIIADKGNGNYSYIDNIQEARKVMVSEFSGTLFTIAKDVKFQLEFNPARVKAYRLIGYENRMLNAEDFNDDKKDAGEMGAGHTVTALYEIIPAGSDEKTGKVDPLKYQQNGKVVAPNPEAEMLTVKLRYKKPDGDASILYEIPVKGEILDFEKTSTSFRFSASVAGFGMLLRDSEYKGDLSFEQVTGWAKASKGEDEEGYRAEFIGLIKTAADLKKSLATNK
ncbi:MAG: von Willebrand factor type A domain-containing protein [Bacteroidales bacterium]